MKREIKEVNNSEYLCKACGLSYKEKSWAEKCWDWCKKNNSCNREITNHSSRQTSKLSNNSSKQGDPNGA